MIKKMLVTSLVFLAATSPAMADNEDANTAYVEAALVYRAALNEPHHKEKVEGLMSAFTMLKEIPAEFPEGDVSVLIVNEAPLFEGWTFRELETQIIAIASADRVFSNILNHKLEEKYGGIDRQFWTNVIENVPAITDVFGKVVFNDRFGLFNCYRFGYVSEDAVRVYGLSQMTNGFKTFGSGDMSTNNATVMQMIRDSVGAICPSRLRPMS